jgi:hypothetical protein
VKTDRTYLKDRSQTMPGTQTIVATLPECDIHRYQFGVVGVPALYDVITRQRPSGNGPWANVCQECFDNHTPGVLGVGHGQRLVLAGEVVDEQPEPVEPCDHVGAGADLTSEGMECRRCGGLIESLPL